MKQFVVCIMLASSLYSCSQNNSISPETSTLLLMENEMQKMNKQYVRLGSNYYFNVKEEINVSGYFDALPEQVNKLRYILTKMDEINTITSKIINEIDLVKLTILKEKYQESAVIKTNSDFYPDVINLFQLSLPAIKIAWNDSKTLTNDITTFRNALVMNCANYKLGEKCTN